MPRAAAVLALLLLAAVPAARAADPSSGKVSKDSPKVTWTGSVTSFQSWQLYNQDVRQCLAPSCDTFTLEVADGPATLQINVSSADSPSYVEVIGPDGGSELYGSGESVRASIKNAANGTYTIHVAQNEQTQATHEGTAQLIFPSAAPAPAAPPAATPPAAQPPAPVTLEVLTSKARRSRSVAVRLRSSGVLTRVRATLAKGRRVVARGRLGRLDGRGAVRLKASRKLGRGRYTVRVTGVDEAGRKVSASRSLRLR